MTAQQRGLRGGDPAAWARRRIISFTAGPVIARSRITPVACTDGDSTRRGVAGSGTRMVRHTCSTPPSPASGCSAPPPSTASTAVRVVACRRSTRSTARRSVPGSAVSKACRTSRHRT